MTRVLGVLGVLTLLAAGVPARGAAEGGRGRELYDKYCSQCHGLAGDGKGHAAGRVKPEPRDFTAGKYKFRTTPSGMLPTDDDLRRVIRQGLPYTSMPAWPNFSDDEVQAIIAHLKTFSDAFGDPKKQAQAIEIPEPPPVTQESVTKGRTVYENQGCAACHGDQGRGNGTSAPTLTDDWGRHIRPADLTQRWTFRGGPTRRDIFRTFSTGLNGTPMPSYADVLKVEDRFDLVNYIDSLGTGDAPNYSTLLRVHYVADEIDVKAGAAAFDSAAPARFPLIGQVIQPGRDFYPSASSVEVRALHNLKDMAILVRWHDMRAETTGRNAPNLVVPREEENQASGGSAAAGGGDDFWGAEAAEPGAAGSAPAEGAGGGDDFWGEGQAAAPAAAAGGEFSDAAAIQFPLQLPTGNRKPYFIFGDAQNPVDLWFVDLARGGRAQQFAGHGSASIETAAGDDLEVASGYDDGEWWAIFKRPMRSTYAVTFQQEQFCPIAFSVWDGFNRERGNKRALSAWFYLYVEPSEQVSLVGPVVRVGLFTLAVELLLCLWIRRASAGRSARTNGEPHAAVPEGGRIGR